MFFSNWDKNKTRRKVKDLQRKNQWLGLKQWLLF